MADPAAPYQTSPTVLREFDSFYSHNSDDSFYASSDQSHVNEDNNGYESLATSEHNDSKNNLFDEGETEYRNNDNLNVAQNVELNMEPGSDISDNINNEAATNNGNTAIIGADRSSLLSRPIKAPPPPPPHRPTSVLSNGSDKEDTPADCELRVDIPPNNRISMESTSPSVDIENNNKPIKKVPPKPLAKPNMSPKPKTFPKSISDGSHGRPSSACSNDSRTDSVPSRPSSVVSNPEDETTRPLPTISNRPSSFHSKPDRDTVVIPLTEGELTSTPSRPTSMHDEGAHVITPSQVSEPLHSSTPLRHERPGNNEVSRKAPVPPIKPPAPISPVKPPTTGQHQPSASQNSASAITAAPVVKPALSTNRASTRRSRPVITVVSAQPMNVVGFRDVAANNPSAASSNASVTVKPTERDQTTPTGTGPVLPSYEAACEVVPVPLIPKLSKPPPAVQPKPVKPLPVKPLPPKPTTAPKEPIGTSQVVGNSLFHQYSSNDNLDGNNSQKPAVQTRPTVICPKRATSLQNLDTCTKDLESTQPVTAIPFSQSMSSRMANSNGGATSKPVPAVKPKPKQPSLMPKPLIGNKIKFGSTSKSPEPQGNKPLKVLPQSATEKTSPLPTSRKPTIIRAVNRSSSIPNGLEKSENATNEAKENLMFLNGATTTESSDCKTGPSNGLKSSRNYQSMLDVSSSNKTVQKRAMFEKPNGGPPPLPASNPVANSRLMCRSMMDFREAGLIEGDDKPAQPTVVPRKTGPTPQPRARPRSMINTKSVSTFDVSSVGKDNSEAKKKKTPPGRPPPPSRPPLPVASKLKRPVSMMNLSSDNTLFAKDTNKLNGNSDIAPTPMSRKPSIGASSSDASIEDKRKSTGSGPPPRPAGGPPKRPPAMKPLKTPIVHTDAEPVISVPPRTPNNVETLHNEPAGHSSQESNAPSLPDRPGPGHPLYHYTVTGPHAIAAYDYSSSRKDELSFKSGDVITLLKFIDDEWLEGSIGTETGMFPAGFVEIKEAPPRDEQRQSTPSVSLTGPRCVARFDFGGENSDDLMFKEGDMIVLLEYVGTEWLKGELDGRTGVFPVDFVEVIEPLAVTEPTSTSETMYKVPMPSWDDEVPVIVPSAVEKQNNDNKKLDMAVTSDVVDKGAEKLREEPHCIALYDYQSGESTDLNFNLGDEIELLEKVDEQWLKGKCGGKTGMFPAGFVEIVVDLPTTTVSSPNMKSLEVVEKTPEITPDGATNNECTVAEALFDYPGGNEDDLTFNAGDQIMIDEKISAEWYRGHIGERTGMFPANFIQVPDIHT